MRRPVFYLALAAAAGCGAAAAGCIHRSSGDLHLGGTVALPAIAERADAPDAGAGRRLTSLDRSAWQGKTIAAPVEVVLTLPATGSATPVVPDAGRRSGAYPAPAEAITLERGSFEQALANGFLPPLRAAWDFVTLPGRFAGDGEGVAGYQRTPRGGGERIESSPVTTPSK